MLRYSSIGKYNFLFTGYQQDIRIILMTMKTTTDTGKNQKLIRKVPEECVETI